MILLEATTKVNETDRRQLFAWIPRLGPIGAFSAGAVAGAVLGALAFMTNGDIGWTEACLCTVTLSIFCGLAACWMEELLRQFSGVDAWERLCHGGTVWVGLFVSARVDVVKSAGPIAWIIVTSFVMVVLGGMIGLTRGLYEAMVACRKSGTVQ